MKSLVSVIMPCYNHGKYVQEAIYSVINQTYPNIELIILNDGSSDDTHEKISELEGICKARFTLFQYINKTNEGVAATLNKGIIVSSGVYITTCASDDRYVENFVEKAVNMFLQLGNSFAMVTGNANFINASGLEIYFDKYYNIVHESEKATYRSLKELTLNYDPIDFIEGYGTYKNVISGCCGFLQATMFIKRALIDVGMFNSANRVEDVGVCLKIAKKYKAKYIDEVLFNYRLHGANSVTQNTAFLSKEITQLLLDEKEYCFSQGLEEEWRNRSFMELNNILRHGEYRFVSKFIKHETLVSRYAWHVVKTFIKKINKRLDYSFYK